MWFIFNVFMNILPGSAIPGMVTIPVSMYQTVVAQMNDGRAHNAPVQLAMTPNSELSDTIQVNV